MIVFNATFDGEQRVGPAFNRRRFALLNPRKMRCAQSDGIRRARTNPQGPEQVIDGSMSCRSLNNARSAMISPDAGHVACCAESDACSWRFSYSEPLSSPRILST